MENLNEIKSNKEKIEEGNDLKNIYLLPKDKPKIRVGKHNLVNYINKGNEYQAIIPECKTSNKNSNNLKIPNIQTNQEIIKDKETKQTTEKIEEEKNSNAKVNTTCTNNTNNTENIIIDDEKELKHQNKKRRIN